MKAILQRCGVVVVAVLDAVRAVYAADLPTAGAAKESGASSNCFASLWNWLNASVSDCPLTYHGFTVYGTVDVGYGYDTAGIGFGKWFDKGVFYPIQKTSGAGRWSWSPDALSASTLGVKMEEPIGGDWLLIGAAEMNFNPLTLLPETGPRPSWTTTSIQQIPDRERRLQPRRPVGQLARICGRQQRDLWHADRRANDFAVQRSRRRYDPTRSNAFSLVGNTGPFPRFGYPEIVRVNTGVQYRLEYGNFRVAGLAQLGNGYALGNGSMGEYEAQVGATFGGLSVDVVARYAKDAVALQSFSGVALPAGYNPNSILQATLANAATVLVGARYKWDRTELYGGYTYAQLANPSDAFPNGFSTIASGIFVPPGEVNATFYDVNEIMHTIWVGAKYDVSTNLSVAGSLTYQRQNDFLPASGVCTGSGDNTSSPRCAGSDSAVSFLVDYNPVPRADLYGGVTITNVYGGLASGYFKTQNIDPTIGLRIRFLLMR